MNKQQTITACVFIHKDGKGLIAKRAETKQFFPGKWELPGGHIEWGEMVEEGLKRELREEFQIDIELEKLYYEFTWIGENEHIIEVEYTAHMKNPDQKLVMEPSEISDYAWITKDEVDKYFENNDAEGIAVKKGFETVSA